MAEHVKPRSNRTLFNMQEMPFSYVEAYKSLRTNLQFAAVDKSVKRLIVTSSIPGEGKTTVAINLAITLAETGAKVLLIDCDLRKPSIYRYLQINNKLAGGLTTILSKKAAIGECTGTLNGLRVDVIPSGPIPPNPAELLTSKRMMELLDTLSERYEYIVIDTPPVSVVTDAAALSRNSDGVIFVIRQGSTKIGNALLAKKNLESVGAKVIGCVLNAFQARNSSKAYAYYTYKKGYYAYK